MCADAQEAIFNRILNHMNQDSLFELPAHTHPAKRIYPKDRTARRETARVLILVKARPEPSTSYGDTVCVAGIRVDQEEYRWVRLYPIPFRSLEHYKQFKKYTFVNVPVIPAQGDFRSESYKPDRDNLEVEPGGPLTSPKQRMKYVEPMISELSMCDILEIARSSDNDKLYPSLAVIRPREILGLEIHPFPGWNEKQRRAIENSARQGDLMDLLNDEPERIRLEEPRFAVHMKYLCQRETCSVHRQPFLDWELEAFTRRHAELPDADTVREIQNRWGNVLATEKKPVLYVGNQHKATLAYSVLGVQRTK